MGPLRGEDFTKGFLSGIERIIKLFRVFAAGLGEVGFAAPLSAHNRGELLDQRVGRDAVDEVFGDGGQERDFPVRGAAKDDDAALDLGAELVGEIAKIAAADVVDSSRHQLNIADLRYGALVA